MYTISTWKSETSGRKRGSKPQAALSGVGLSEKPVLLVRNDLGGQASSTTALSITHASSGHWSFERKQRPRPQQGVCPTH